MKSFLSKGRTLAVLAAAGAVVASSVVAGSPAQAEDKKTIGFSPIAMAIPPLAGLAKGV